MRCKNYDKTFSTLFQVVISVVSELQQRPEEVLTMLARIWRWVCVVSIFSILLSIGVYTTVRVCKLHVVGAPAPAGGVDGSGQDFEVVRTVDC